jgi:DNA repair ATPase RecN
MPSYSGLYFAKFDLHVHTPASHDFPDKSITARQIVEKALAEGMKGIAITDHNTGAFIDELKKAATGTNLTVFPGVEITCTGGETGIHVNAILDIDKDQRHIEALLAAFKISPDDFGKKDAVTSFSPYDVAETIGKEPFNGISILAHCTSSKGVLHDIKGATRTKIFTSKYLLAVESSEKDFTDADKILNQNRAVDLLNGKDDNFNNRKLAVYISSDSRKIEDKTHTFQGIANRYTLFKVDENVTLESLRQCFIDRDVRIRQSFESNPIVYPYIKSISVTGGFFDGKTASFHQGLNSILGAKGVGKSLLIELMRFVLAQPSTQADILADHERKLEKRLQTYSSVHLKFIDETGKECSIERRYNPTEGNPYSDPDHEALAASFPVLFLSQNEIVKIAENETEQMNFIDRFFDFRHYLSRIRLLEKDIGKYDEHFATGLRAIGELNEVEKQLNKLKLDLQKLDHLLKDPIYDNYKKIETKNRVIQGQIKFTQEFEKKLNNYSGEINSFSQPQIDELIKDDPQIKRITDIINAGKQRTLIFFENASKDITTIYSSLEKELKPWNSIFLEEKKKYETHIRDAGGDKKAIEAQRLKVVKEIDELQKREKSLIDAREKVKVTVKEREELIKKLFSVYDEFSAERKAKCKKFETESNKRLKLRLDTSSNKDEFRARLVEMKKGSYLRDVDIEAICKTVSPYEFIIELLRYQATKDLKILSKLNEKICLEFDKLQLLCDFLLSQIKFEDLMKLQYKARPQDRPEIKFQISENSYEHIRDISIGQKCTAMLIMCLSDGCFPIIIDQPEDSLDVRSVWDDMCTKIRRGKESRQFIFTTHNSCLAVASDTDKYTIIESTANSAIITKSGALDNQELKEEVIKYLEGGRITYSAKADKYGIE